MSTGQKKEDFKWTDDEAELLLNVTHDYKVKKISESVDWESVKTKYENIVALMRQELPVTLEEARDNCLKDYPHTKEQITKKILTSKLKAILIKFRDAVDSGCRSGHGRVIMLYYDLCEKIWDGSPAAQKIEGGLESADIVAQVADKTHSNMVDFVVETLSEIDHNDVTTDDTDETSAGNQDFIRKRRELLDGQLST